MIVTVIVGVSPSHATQCDAHDLPSFAGKEIRLLGSALLFSTDVLKIDIDGSARSYGVDDHGVENICNGLSAAEPPECRNSVAQGRCYSACVESFRRWHSESRKPEDLGKYMRSIGLGGAYGSVPRVQLQKAPNDDMFVSHTSVRYGPWKRGEPLDRIELQDAQIEPFEVPFFVIPGNFRKSPWDATPGDVGVIVNANRPDRVVHFVVGDVGGRLDEGSAKLQELLSGRPLVPQRKRNVLGEVVERYGDLTYEREAGKPLDLRVAIFRGTSSYDRRLSGGILVLQAVSDQAGLLKHMEDLASAELRKLGGIEKVISCTGPSH